VIGTKHSSLFRQPDTELKELFRIGMIPAMNWAGPMGGSHSFKKGISNVRNSQLQPPGRNRSRRCFHRRDAVRFRRDFAADRLSAIAHSRTFEMTARFTLNRGDGKIMGVAAGLADYTGVDPTLIRLGFVAATLLTGPLMVLLYLIAGFVTPKR
jgi:phage shock protein C